MRLRRLDPSRRADREAFSSLPFELYAGHPLWVPPLRGEMEEIMRPERHPFYEHSTADFFVVEDDGWVLGRVAALENRRYNAFRGSRAAFFGYFEAIDENEVSGRLLDAAAGWARERGLDTLIGPRGVAGIDGSVLVEGFERRPALGVPYNFPYYDRLLRDYGFGVEAELLSGYLPAGYRPGERFQKIAAYVQRKKGLWVKSFRSRSELRRWLPRILEAHRAAFSQTRSFYPPTPAEVQRLVGTLLTIADPGLIKLILKEEEIVGFIFAYHDVGDGLRRSGGRLWPLGWLEILRERRRTRWVNINGAGLLPEYQGGGGNALLYVELAKTINRSQFEHVEVIQVDAENRRSRADMENLGVNWVKKHRHYRMEWVQS